MLDIFSYSFFQYALIAGVLISCISAIFGVFIVMRKEANITHSIANFLFLGIALSLFVDGDYYLFLFLFAILASVLIFFIEKTHFVTRESTREIISQTGIAGGIFLLGLLGNVTMDINNFLFGSILFIQPTDLVILAGLTILIVVAFFFFGKKFLRVIINEDIAKSQGMPTDWYNFLFLLFLSLFIAVSIKMFGIMLIGAFLIIPPNIAKILATSLRQVFFLTGMLALSALLVGLFGSYLLDTSTSSGIVLVLICFFLIALFWRNIRK